MSMFWNDGYGWSGFFWMVIWTLIWIGLGSMVFWTMMRSASRRHMQPLRHEWRIQSNEPSALEILNRRYARGELDAATYEAMRERIQASYTDLKPLGTPTSR